MKGFGLNLKNRKQSTEFWRLPEAFV